MNGKENKSRYTIGLITAGAWGYYYTEIIQGIIKAAEKNNINLLCFAGRELSLSYIESQRNVLYELINKNRMDGLIIPSSAFSSYLSVDDLNTFLQRYKPLPVISIGARIKGFPSILIDNKKGMHDLLVHLIRHHKYKRIAFIRGPKYHPEANARFAVYKETIEECRIPYDERLVAQGDFYLFSGAGGKVITLFLDQRKISFDTLVCSNDILARDAISELGRRGIRVPDDVAVTGFDDITESKYITPPLTTVGQPVFKLGEEAVNVLWRLLSKKDFVDTTIFPTEIVIRRSCGCFSYPDLTIDLKDEKNRKVVVKSNELKARVVCEIKEDNNFTYLWTLENFKNLKWLDHLIAYFSGKNNQAGKKFLLLLEKLIIDVMEMEAEAENWSKIILCIFNILKKHMVMDMESLNNLYNDANNIINNIADRIKSYAIMQYKVHELQLYEISNSFVSCFDQETMKKVIIDHFPGMGISRCFICLYEGRQRKYAKLFIGYDKTQNMVFKNAKRKYPADNLLPDNIDLADRRFSFLILPLLYKDIQLGFIIYEIQNIEETIYDTLTVQISSALRGIRLMEKIKKHSQELTLKVKERTEKLQEVNSRLQKLDSLKNDFIANITHDFRSPLTSILNIAELSLRFGKGLDDENKENFGVIYKASLRLKSAIDRLLELAKMDAHGIQLKIRKIDLVSFLNTTLGFYISSTTGSGIKIIGILPSEKIEDFYSDVEKLEEIIDNVVSNAIKFIDPKTGIITIELKETADNIQIIIVDNGIGIPQDKLDIIFDRFEQAHGGRNSPYRGTGIGLAFAKQLVGYLKGRIWAESEGEGKGARFIIEFKKGKTVFAKKDFYSEAIKQTKRENIKALIEADIETKLQEQTIQEFITELNKENELDYKKGVILIIDDDKTIRGIIMQYLQKNGYKNFILASDGKQGLEAVYKYSPDLIICDFNMPKMRGDEFHDKLTDNPQFKELPFIFLSAVANENIIIERRAKGAGAYLSKPIDEKIFMITVDEQLKKYFEYLKIAQQAVTDELTGLNNRRTVITGLKHELSIRRYRDLSLIFLDIDCFKTINDTCGHQTGDRYLAAIGKIIKTSVRSYDTPGRYGGDEFIIILPDTNIKQAIHVAEVLRKIILGTMIDYQGAEVSASASFGVASLKDNASYIEKALKISDLEDIYEVKNLNKADWSKIEKYKLLVAEILLKMADMSLYKAKQTICKTCGYGAEKNQSFADNKCPQCHGTDLAVGRNRVCGFE